MKTLLDYIQEEYDKSHIDEMLKHLSIEYNLRYSSCIFEGAIFDGCEYLADIISKRALKHLYKKERKFSLIIKNSEVDLKIKFFNEIEITFNVIPNKENFSGGFDSNINIPKYNYYPKLHIDIPHKYNDRDFNINTSDEERLRYFKIDLKGQIMHELTHIWTAYWSNLNNDQMIKRLDKQGYFDYSAFDIEDDEQLGKLVLYYLTNEELSAFITQFHSDLENKKPQTPNDALKILYSSEVYRMYTGIYLAFKKNDKDLIDQTIKVYRKYNKEDRSLSNKEIERRLKNRIKRFNKKLLDTLPKLCASYFDENLLDRSITVDGEISSKDFVNILNKRLYSNQEDEIEIL